MFPPEIPKLRKQGRSPGGRPPGAVRSPIFQNFVRDLRTTVNAVGGKLTLEKDTPGGSGSMIEAFRMLKPHLPDDFIPNALGASTLRNLIDQISEVERALEKIEEL